MADHTVILIHGLWMPGLVLLPFQRWLRAEGYTARRFAYPSWRDGLDENARRLSGFIEESAGSVIHLVAHSLGGLVTLNMLAQQADARIGRVVLLGTPCSGCHSGQTIAALPAFSRLVGRSFADWSRRPRPALRSAAEIGIIAGTRRSVSLGRMIPGLALPNDGLIAVEETRLATATDSIALPVSHSGMLVSRTCTRQIAHFLRAGKFIHG